MTDEDKNRGTQRRHRSPTDKSQGTQIMPHDDLFSQKERGARQSQGHSPGRAHGAWTLADDAVSTVKQRQATTAAGARQFILDHLLRAVTSRGEFDPGRMLDELRGYRLSTDSVIDIYIPAIARILGEMWQDSTLDFAGVTVGSMRLQSLLSIASTEALDFMRPIDDALFMLVTVPMGEQHFLGAFVLAAQLRRLGARVDVSFSENAQEFVSRVTCDPPDMILFSASGKASLDTVSRLVQEISREMDSPPLTSIGGGAADTLRAGGDNSGVDLVSQSAKDALSFAAKRKARLPRQAGR